MDAILVLNAGSSSLKFQVFGIAGGVLRRELRGQIDGIGTGRGVAAGGGAGPRLVARGRDGEGLADTRYAPGDVPDLPAATAVTGAWLAARGGFDLRAVGHRVVHGGPDHDRPVIVRPDMLARLEGYSDLAPLHQANNLAPIRQAMTRTPEIPQVACFDTAFHRTHSAHADHYALPRELHDDGVRRYGFHGISYEYIAERLREVAPDVAAGRVIVAHLGSGASMCALRGGASVESTMGFTPLDGLPMGTRPGQLDPGVVLYLLDRRGMTPADIADLLYRRSGLMGLSGISNDMRELLGSDDPRARFAIEHFVYRTGIAAGGLAAALGGLDAFVFTAGVGENAPEVRALIAGRLGWLGAELDAAANAAGETVISSGASRVRLLVVPTDEELMIARHTLALLPS